VDLVQNSFSVRKTSADWRFHLPVHFTPLPPSVSALNAAFRTKAALRATYTSLAPLYDALVPTVSREARTAGLRRLNVRDGERVLEVGTGTGLAFEHLVAANPSGWTEGVDLTPAMLRRARNRLTEAPHGRYGLRLADATALPYPDDTFDAVFSSYLIDVLPDRHQRAALREIRRVLRPDGRAVLVYLAPPQHPTEHLWTSLATVAPFLVGGARSVCLTSLLQACGLDLRVQRTHVQNGLRSTTILATTQ
jgi:ubiquinone/menaquinone biosynthesis C-methylase UbiE